MPAIDVSLTGPQSRAWELIKPGQTVCLMWGRGTGKSHFMRLVMWLLLAQYRDTVRDGAFGEKVRGIRIAWVMPTLKSFRDVHEHLLTAENAGKWRWLGGKINHSTLNIEFPNGSWVKCAPAKDHTSAAGRGWRPDVALADEFDDCGLSVWDSIVQPWFTEPWSLGIRVPGGTPRRGRHGNLYRLFKAGRDKLPGHHSVHATYLDSPETVNWEEANKAKLGPKPVFAREWLADPDSSEGLVYAFAEAFHVREPPKGMVFTRFAVGGDHGYTDPGCFLLGGITGHGEDATLWILEEVYETERVGSWWDDKAREWQKYSANWWLDPSQPARIRDLQQIVRAKKANNHIDDGVGRVADLLAIRKREDGQEYARLYISPRCKNLIREMGQYRRKRDPTNPDGFLEAIEDRNNHAMDSIRYLAMGEFGPSGGVRYEASSY